MRKLISIAMCWAVTLGAYATNVSSTAFTLSSSAFLNEETLPTLYTCHGKDISPALSWHYVPPNTKTFVLIMSDPQTSSGVFYHWLLYNISPSVSHLNKHGKLPHGAQFGKNSWNKLRYNGPCPPKGETHQYIFTLYALNTKLNLPAGATAKSLLNAMQNHILGIAELRANYGG